MEEFTWEQVLGGLVVFNAVMGAVVSFLLARFPRLKELWKGWKPFLGKLGPGEIKPLAILVGIEVVAVLPVLLACVGAPGYVLEWMRWIPDLSCGARPAWFGLAVGFSAWATGQAAYFKFFKVQD